jgi:hypothetical protein
MDSQKQMCFLWSRSEHDAGSYSGSEERKLWLMDGARGISLLTVTFGEDDQV